jgi:hypothetical protein
MCVCVYECDFMTMSVVGVDWLDDWFEEKAKI